MNMDIESKIKDALKDIDSFKTADCLDVNTIGQYVEKKLTEPQLKAAESHLHTCLFCLKQLNDMTEILYGQKHLKNVKQSKVASAVSFFQRLKELITFTPQQWRFSAVGLAAAWMVFIVSSVVLHYGEVRHGAPKLNPNSIVKISAMGASGKVLREQRGMIVSSDGYIEGNLTPLAGATKIIVTLKDGRTREIDKIWGDDESNLAVMKIADNDLQGIPLADIASMKIGHKVFAVSDGDESSATDAIVFDFKQISGRRKDTSMQYIQVSSQTSTKNTGKLIDGKGNLIGFVITEEENINFAIPANSFRQLVKNTSAIPVSELKQSSFSSEALNYYFNGIMARDAQRTDEAMRHFQKAIQLNPKLIGARIELGLLYYKKHDFDKEAEQYQEVLKLNPDNVDALYNLAWNLESHGKYKEATPMYEKALKLDPEDTETLYQLGLSYLAQGNKGKAMEMYGRLKKIDPGNAEMLRRLMK